MSGRWLRMAAELEEATAAVQNAQNVQKSNPDPTIERSERSERSERLPGLAAENAGTDHSNTSAAVDAFEERAAIAEFDAGIPRTWVEGFAALQCAQAPDWAALRPGMWVDLINAVGLFLDRWGRQAAALGWDSIDLFGALPAAPLARMDQQGLVFFLRDGGEVVGMTAHTATIRRPSAAVQTFRHRSAATRESRTAPLWELVASGGGEL